MIFKSFFITLALFAFTSPSVAASPLNCHNLLEDNKPYPKIINFSSPPRTPKIGNTINTKGLQQWVEAHREFGEDYVELAAFLAANIEILSHSQFESLLRKSMSEFFKSLPKDQSYYIIVAEEKTKSQLWVAHLISTLVNDRPPKAILLDPTKEELESYVKANPASTPLIVDDAGYMGQNLTEAIATIFSLDYSQGRKRIKLNSQLTTPIQLHIVTASIAKVAHSELQRIEGVHQHSSHYMKSARELLQEVSDPIKRKRLEDTFIKQYDEFALDFVLTGFAHKTADMASVVGMSSEETYEFARPSSTGEEFQPKTTPHGATILEGVLIGPDNLYRDTITILNMEEKPYGN